MSRKKETENVIGQLSVFDLLKLSECIEGISSADLGEAIKKLTAARDKVQEREEKPFERAGFQIRGRLKNVLNFCFHLTWYSRQVTLGMSSPGHMPLNIC